MTRIKKLVMEGFKSFAKRTEFIFDNQFNVILGANGSGKSNVVDALCFVLGKSSSKAMRAEKSSHLIYNGGKTKKPADSAEVTIVFDNKNRTFPLEEEEVRIGRIVNQDGQSKYRINNKTRTRQELLELLQYAKVDPDGYNIILQGDIIRLVEMSPIERRGLIEEIAGIGVYEEKRAKALLELEKVGQKLNEADIILKERETYLKELKKDRDQAQKYNDLNNRIKQNKATYVKIQMDRKDEQRKSLDERNTKHVEKIKKVQEKIAALKQDILERKEEMKKISEEIESKGEVEQVALQRHIEQLKVGLATKKSRIQSCETELVKIATKKDQILTNLSEIEKKVSDLAREENELAHVRKKKEQQLKELVGTISSFNKKHELDSDGALEKEIDQLDEKAEQLQKESAHLQENYQQLLREQDRLEFQVKAVDERIAKVLEVEKEHKQEIEQLKQKKQEFKKVVVQLNDLLNQDSKDAQQLGQYRRELQTWTEKLRATEVKQASVREARASNIAIKKILENKGSLGEIYDVVSELGQVDDTYAKALEIAGGPKIDSIVVEDDKTAARCISFLKQNKLGIATFLPLNKIQSVSTQPELKSYAKQKGVHGVAVDLVTYDPRFKNVFSYVFGNTLVVDSIETARKIGIGKAKMVTLDGDLTEISGAMKGGYHHRQATGRFKGAELQKQAESCRAEVLEREELVRDLERRRQESEGTITKLREFKATLEGEIIKSEKSLHLDSEDVLATQQYRKELVDKLAQTKQELEVVQQEMNTFTKKITDLKIKRQQVKNRVMELRNPTVLAELHAFEQKKRELEADVVKHDGELKNLHLQRTEVHERDRENSGRILKELGKEETQFKEEIHTLGQAMVHEEQDLSVKEQQQVAFYQKFKGLFEQRNRIADDVAATETTVLQHEENMRKEELAVNMFSIELARIKAEFAGLTAEFEQYPGVPLDLTKSEAELKKEIHEFERMMATIGSVNLRALEIYDKVKQEYECLLEKKRTLVQEKTDVEKLMQEIEKQKKGLFLDALKAVNTNFERIFSQLSTKGAAYLKLEDDEKPFDGGLLIKVRITGEKFLDIRSLSGGEKALTALAFVFSIQEHSPATFYLLDEVDAPLDKKNSSLLGDLIKRYSEKAQYIVVSHNDALIQHADALYGVTLEPELGQSAVVSLKV